MTPKLIPLNEKQEAAFAFFETVLRELDAVNAEIGKAACLASDAWELFDAAIDEGQPTDVRNELAEVAEAADDNLSAHKIERDVIKAALLDAATVTG